jgi:hypothetical protein
MAVSLSQYAGAGAQFFDNNGNPLAGGLIYTYAAGTTTPAATYTTYTGGTANANPIVLDSAGRTPAQIWLTSGSSYKFVLQTALGVTIKTDDNIYASYQLEKQVGVTVGKGYGNLSSNVAVGDTSLMMLSSGSATNNTAVGYNSAFGITSAPHNVSVGASSLYTSSTGAYNTAIGSQSLFNSNGASNVAVGYRALYTETSGQYNVAVGVDSLFLKNSGDSNVAIGYQAANSLTAGDNNVVIGYDADVSSATVSNEITLGNSSITSLRVPGLTLTAGAKWINNGTQTVAALVAAATAGAGARAVVTDANATTFHAIVAGGGANVVPVFSDGTNWRIG